MLQAILKCTVCYTMGQFVFILIHKILTMFLNANCVEVTGVVELKHAVGLCLQTVKGMDASLVQP